MKAKVKSVIKYFELSMPDGRSWQFEHLQDLLKFAKENGIDVSNEPRKIEEDEQM
jgi:hypothetical protein